jgi:hypothetical protein
LDLGLYAIAVIVGVSVGMALLAWESAKCYVAAGVVAIATLTAGNIFLSVVFGCLRIGMEITPGYSSINVVFACTSTAALMPRLYAKPQLLWLVCPVLLYWVQRIWLMAFRGVDIGDPVVFALRDKVSYIVGLLAAVILWIASA